MEKISYVIPCYKSSASLPGVVSEINETMSAMEEYDYEIILVNDYSPDNTYEVIRMLTEKYENIIGINLAKNFGQHAALMAGMREITGDIIVFLDDDGQTPANEVFKLIDKLNEGYDVVYASYEHKHHSGFRNFGSIINSRMTEWLIDKPKELYISSYFVAKRFIVDEIIRYTNPYPYVIGLVLRTTKNISCVAVNHRDREQGQSGYTLAKLISLLFNGFTAFSIKPLRIATVMGLCCSVLGFFYAIYAIINKMTNPAAPLGWTSTIIILLILGGMILFVLGLIGEYIGRMSICTNNSPQYVIKEKCGKTNKTDRYVEAEKEEINK